MTVKSGNKFKEKSRTLEELGVIITKKVFFAVYKR